MDRIIKFRGVAVSSGEMVYGCLIKKRYTAFAMWMIEDENGLGSDVVTETIGQFTGLKDKNGKEIFEGDILVNPFNDKKEVVTYGLFSEDTLYPKCLSIGFKVNNRCGLGFDVNGEMTHEIIGNIHQNEELIK
jgi:uncharacterized phage protein (TIGR01671 family)